MWIGFLVLSGFHCTMQLTHIVRLKIKFKSVIRLGACLNLYLRLSVNDVHTTRHPPPSYSQLTASYRPQQVYLSMFFFMMRWRIESSMVLVTTIHVQKSSQMV